MNNLFYKQIQKSLTQKTVRVVESSQGAYVTIDGKKKMNLCSSHYLGFAAHPRINHAVKKAVEIYGVGTGYRTLAGTHLLHTELEKRIAHFKDADDAIVLTGGYMANCAAIQTIIGKEDIVISDELNHASIIDAVRLSQVKNKFIYRHLDMKDLESQLQAAEKLASSKRSDGLPRVLLIVTDGVFSMDGDLAPLPDIVRLAKKYDALTMVDDAHGEGVLGKGGKGIVDHFNVHGQIDIEVGTLSKAFSVMGGFITGRKELIAFYKQKARQFLFSNTLTIPDTAALIEGLKILEESDTPVKKLWENTNYLKKTLVKLGFDCGNSKTPITPIMLGKEDLAIKFSAKLYEMDIFATPIVFPMVPKEKARVRLIPSAAHSKADLDKAIAACVKAGKELGVLR